MSSRWESSRKSLFVKTVWVKGQRHVILFEEDPVADYLKMTKKRSSRATSSLTNKSTSRSSTFQNTSSCENFRVPSVKLLLAGIRNLKKEPLTTRRTFENIHSSTPVDTLSIDVVPNEKVTFKNINDDITIKSRERYNEPYNNSNLLKAVKISRMSNSLDIDYHQEHINGSEYDENHYETHNLSTPQYQNVNINFGDQYNNSLSDRVLMWLDLATQTAENVDNKETSEKLKAMPASNRIAAAHSSNLRKQISLTNRKVLSRSRSYDCYENKNRNDWHEKQGTFLKTTAITCHSAMKISNLEDSSLICEKIFDLHSPRMQVTSHTEDSPVLKMLPSEQAAKRRTEILKRQLHIFMPNIPKKNDDCDSNLSSKSRSSSFMKRCSL